MEKRTSEGTKSETNSFTHSGDPWNAKLNVVKYTEDSMQIPPGTVHADSLSVNSHKLCSVN